VSPFLAAYPQRLAGNPGFPRTLTFVACSGAVIGDLYNGRSTESGQLSKLGPDVSTVTLTVGGNDVQFGLVLGDCALTSGCVSRFGIVVPALIWATGSRFERLYRDILRNAPKARVYVLAYPHLFPRLPSPFCDGIDFGEALWINGMEDLLNRTIANAITKIHDHRLIYVDTSGALAGGELCAGGPRYMNGLVLDANRWMFSFHPTVGGQGKIADVVRQKVTGVSARP